MPEFKDILFKNDFHFNKRYGQNFISDTNLLASIADLAGVTAQTEVLEIGVGAGALTRELAVRSKRVTGYEIDRKLEPVLRETLSGFTNIKLVFGDFMRADMHGVEQALGGAYTVVANLPYYITTPVLWKLLEEGERVERMVLMVQEEVARRLTAKCGTADYGGITPSIDVVADAVYLKRVNRNMFYPQPNVDSALVRIDMRRDKYVVDVDLFRKTVKCAFTSRRKTLVNNLIIGLGLTRTAAEKVLSDCGFGLNIRGETLDTAQFALLTNRLYKGKDND